MAKREAVEALQRLLEAADVQPDGWCPAAVLSEDGARIVLLSPGGSAYCLHVTPEDFIEVPRLMDRTDYTS